MKKFFIWTFVALFISYITPTIYANNEQNVVHLSEISEEGSLTGTVTVTQTKTKPKARKNTTNLLKARQKRENHIYQEAPKDTSKQYQLTVKSHAYCIRGLTSRGVPTRMGVIAVDPKVIPYGSKIHIPGYGWGTALDTGGAIQGNTIDIWMPTYSQCMDWGTRNIKITVIKPSK